MSVFAIAGADGTLYHRAWYGYGSAPYSGRWTDWETIAGGQAAIVPFTLAATASDAHRIDVFVIGREGSPWHTFGLLEHRRDILRPGGYLFVGDALVTDSGRLRLVMQSDGNLVLYGPPGAQVWSSQTAGQSVTYVTMQTDGNLVMYGPIGGPPPWGSLAVHKIWETGTHSPGSYLRLYDGDAGGAQIVASPTDIPWRSTPLIPADRLRPGARDRLAPGEGLAPGESLISNNGATQLVFRYSGELALENVAFGTLWLSPASAQPPWQAVMQHDGNFVVYANNAQPVFASATWSAVPVNLIVQDSGALVIQDSLSAAIIWQQPDHLPSPAPPPPPGQLYVFMGLATPGVDEGDVAYQLTFNGYSYFTGSITRVDVIDSSVLAIRFVLPGKSAPDDCGNDDSVIAKDASKGPMSLSRSELDRLGNAADGRMLNLAACATRTGEWLNADGTVKPIALVLYHS